MKLNHLKLPREDENMHIRNDKYTKGDIPCAAHPHHADNQV